MYSQENKPPKVLSILETLGQQHINNTRLIHKEGKVKETQVK